MESPSNPGQFRHLYPELGALAANPQVTPARVLACQPQDQLHERRIEASLDSGLTSVGPSTSHEFTMPSHQCRRGDQERRPTLPRQQPGQGRQDQAVSWSVAGAGNLAAAPPTGGEGRRSRRPCRLVWDRGPPARGPFVQRGRPSWRPCRPSWQMPIVAAQSCDLVLAPFRLRASLPQLQLSAGTPTVPTVIISIMQK